MTPYAQLMHLIQQTDLKVHNAMWVDNRRMTTVRRTTVNDPAGNTITVVEMPTEYPHECEMSCFKALKAVMDYTTWQ